MSGELIDRDAPHYQGPLPKPRGLLPVPPEIVEQVAREQARGQPYYTDDYARLVRDEGTLSYYYEGEMVAYRSTPSGVEVLAVDPEEVGPYLRNTPLEERQGVIVGRP